MPYFPDKTARDPCQRDMLANFLTAPSAWFQDGTGPNSEDLPCPSVTSYWCSAEGFYLTVFEHQTPIGKPPSMPSTSNHNFLSNSSWGVMEPMMPELLLQIWLTFYSMDFEKTSSKFGSTTLSGSFCANHGDKCSWPT